MGALWSRFKHKPDTKELLDDIEKKIKNIHEYKHSTEQQQKRLIGALIFYSSLFYILSIVITYLWYLPNSTEGQILCLLALLLFPILIILTKKLLQWYFRRKIERKNEELIDLTKQKRAVLDNVMETETYKVAKEILEKYDPDTLRKSLKLEEKGTKTLTVADMEIVRRMIPTKGQGPSPPRFPHSNLKMHSPITVTNPQSLEKRMLPPPPPGMHINGRQLVRPQGPPLPRPVLPRERTVLDRVIDFLVGEGPSNRYALICTRCCSHNGMALREEYEYLSFRCCYCFHWNQAKRQRPEAPRLPEPPGGPLALPATSSDNEEGTPAPTVCDENEAESGEERGEAKQEKEEDDNVTYTKANPIDASGDIISLPYEPLQPPRSPKKTHQQTYSPKNPQAKKKD